METSWVVPFNFLMTFWKIFPPLGKITPGTSMVSSCGFFLLQFSGDEFTNGTKSQHFSEPGPNIPLRVGFMVIVARRASVCDSNASVKVWDSWIT